MLKLELKNCTNVEVRRHAGLERMGLTVLNIHVSCLDDLQATGVHTTCS